MAIKDKTNATAAKRKLTMDSGNKCTLFSNKYII